MKLTIELTYDCPLNCVHCSSSLDNSSNLTLEDIKKVLQQYKIDEIILSGGEPFTHPNFVSIVIYLLSRYPVSLNTCGISHSMREFYYFDEQMGRKVFKHSRYDLPYALLQNFHKIYVSIYGDETFHNLITSRDSYASTWSFYWIARFIMSRTYGLRHNRVVINTPIFSKPQVDKLIAYMVGCEVDFENGKQELGYLKRRLDFSVHFIRLLKHGRATNIDVLSREDQLQIALNIKKEFPERIHISQSLLHERCNWEQKLTLLPNGGLIHCVAGKLHPNPNQRFICDKVMELRDEY